MNNKRILISGAGIAGLTLAHFLKEHGFQPTVIEKAPSLRSGGYMIDLFASGIFVAQQMGIERELAKRNYKTLLLRQFDDKGKQSLKLNVANLKEHLEAKGEGSFYNFLRTDLVDVLYHHVKADVSVQFGTSIQAIQDTGNEVQVTFDNGEQASFDLLVGADGIHSNVRNLLYSPQEIEQRFLGYYVAGVGHSIPIPKKYKNEIISHTRPKQQIMTYTIGENQSSSLFVFQSEQLPKLNLQEKITQLRQEFEGFTEPIPQILDQADKLNRMYFDEVAQIRIKGAWSKGRVALIGDAAYCITFLSGQGASMAMTGAYVLAQQLIATQGNYQQAYATFEQKLRPSIETMQAKAVKNANSYLPSSAFSLWIRNLLAPVLFSKLFASLVIRQLGAYNYFADKSPDELIPKKRSLQEQLSH